jgi:hypothetical protein
MPELSPTDTRPELPSIEKALLVDVANVDGEDVARYSTPPAFLKLQWLEVSEPSERVSCGAVEEAN